MKIDIRQMHWKESALVSNLMQSVFTTFQGPTTSEEGRHTFASEFSSERVLSRYNGGDLFLVALHEGKIVGMIAVRDSSHIFGLFVSPNYQCQGVATNLWYKAVEVCQKQCPNSTFTVNASEYALLIYQKWGFRKKGAKQERKGIEFIPMELSRDQ